MPIAHPSVCDLAAAVLLSWRHVLAGCGEGPKQPAAPPPPTVTVAKPVKRTIVDQDEYVGRFVAVDVGRGARARLGLSRQGAFPGRPGRSSRAISCSPSTSGRSRTRSTRRAPISSSRAPISTFTEADLARGKQLLRDRTISEQVFDQRTQAFRNAQASVAANEAMVRQAELDLEFTELRAPVAGRIGDRRVTPGNLVTGGTGGTTTLLATIVSIDPIRFEFTFDEASLLRYERLARDGNGRDRPQHRRSG